MLAYVDENGNLSSSPPIPRKQKDKEESIEHLYTGIPVREPESAERQGRVDFFNEEKGFGFIKDASSQERIFVHVSQLTEPLQENDKVVFQTERGPRGITAVQVKKVR
jgi:cold shock CspA family protein